VIGTPGEEGAGGKVIELEAGVFDDVDAAVMFHPADRTIIDRRMLACLHLSVRFHGVAAHSGKNPEAGRNALAAMIQFFVAVDGLRQHIEADARVHGIITNGGAAANVVPDLTEADFYVRHRTLEAATALAGRVARCAEGAALGSGTTVEVWPSAPPYAHLHTNRAMAERLQTHLVGLGVAVEAPLPNDATGSTDAGNVSLAIPTVHPFIQIVDRGVPSHSVAFREAAATPKAQDAMLTMAKAMADLGADLLGDADLRERVRTEHQDRIGAVGQTGEESDLMQAMYRDKLDQPERVPDSRALSYETSWMSAPTQDEKGKT
jgi:amidohydrolase